MSHGNYQNYEIFNVALLIVRVKDTFFTNETLEGFTENATIRTAFSHTAKIHRIPEMISINVFNLTVLNMFIENFPSVNIVYTMLG